MKKIIFSGMLLLSTCFIRAQIITPIALNSATTKGTANNITFEFSLGEMATTTITNSHIITQGMLQPLTVVANSALPVLGLQFSARRLNNRQVQLDWQTLQEISNKGFFIQRKRETENTFIELAFEKSKAFNGNSSTPLNYAKVDTNAYNGRTYYRLRQEDMNGTFTYSTVRIVDGDATKAVVLKAWPIPAPKDFSVTVLGVTKDVLLLYDATGKLLREIAIQEGEQIKITALASGLYFLKLKSQPDITQKITVQ